MTRMTKEFSLVLLGSGLLTASSLFWPEQDLVARADEAAAQQVAGNVHHRSHPHLIFLHSGGRAGVSSPAKANITRGGFGSLGHHISGVS